MGEYPVQIITIIIFVIMYIAGKSFEKKDIEQKQQDLREKNKDNVNLKDTILCPKCLSLQTSANKTRNNFN